MALNNQRPDTPLATTPEPQPVSSGLQPSTQMGMIPQQRVATKFEQTADSAINKIKAMTPAAPAAPAIPAAPQQ